jgi:hypothetical protein
MKNFPNWALALLVISLAFVACKKNGSSDDDIIPNLGEFKASIDGSSWTADGAAGGLNEEGVLAIGASRDNQSGFGISIENPEPNMEYAFTTGNTEVSATYTTPSAQSAFITVLGGSGSIKLTTYNSERAKGTFTFTATDAFGATVNITNGSFDVPLVE